MRSDIFWVAGVFLIIGLWSFVLITTLTFVFIFPQNILMNSDIDLSLPTLVLLSFNFIYLCLGIFIFSVYLLKIGKVERDHLNLMSRKYYSGDLCSIIIPAKDEENVIRRAVLLCLEQTYKNIEVIVISHNSTDRTYEEAAQVKDKRVRAFDLRTRAAGKSIALNYGIDRAYGKYILVLDADTVLERDFIEIALPAFNDGSYVAVQGRALPINRNYNILTNLLGIEYDLWSEPILTTRSVLGKRCPLLGTGFIIRKDVLVEVGMFSNSLVDDHELTCRLLKKKHRILFLPFCKAYAEEPPSLEIMLRQRARWGRGFLNCLNQRMAEPTDIIGNLLWLMPIGSFFGSIMLFLVAYASVHNMIFEYLPYTFTYLPLDLWFLFAGILYGLNFLVIFRVHGLRKGLKHAGYIIPFIPFSQYGLVVLYKALFIRTWGNTKTLHGFAARKSEMPALQQAQK
jgi:biofilm PGA synthesis N-glycosyltransferase PgaC